jgi:hypothetical protein
MTSFGETESGENTETDSVLPFWIIRQKPILEENGTYLIMQANRFPEKPEVNAREGREGHRLILKKVQNCRGWLSILRAAGSGHLFAEQQQVLGELDDTIEEVLVIADEARQTPSLIANLQEPEAMAERILFLVKQCLQDLNQGRGLSKESRSMLIQMRRRAESPPQQNPAE